MRLISDVAFGVVPTSNGRYDRFAATIVVMVVPLALRVAAPAARPHLPALAGAAVLALLQAGVTLAEPWPLALAVDHALHHAPFHGLLAVFNTASPLALLLIAGATLVILKPL